MSNFSMEKTHSLLNGLLEHCRQHDLSLWVEKRFDLYVAYVSSPEYKCTSTYHDYYTYEVNEMWLETSKMVHDPKGLNNCEILPHKNLCDTDAQQAYLHLFFNNNNALVSSLGSYWFDNHKLDLTEVIGFKSAKHPQGWQGLELEQNAKGWRDFLATLKSQYLHVFWRTPELLQRFHDKLLELPQEQIHYYYQAFVEKMEIVPGLPLCKDAEIMSSAFIMQAFTGNKKVQESYAQYFPYIKNFNKSATDFLLQKEDKPVKSLVLPVDDISFLFKHAQWTHKEYVEVSKNIFHVMGKDPTLKSLGLEEVDFYLVPARDPEKINVYLHLNHCHQIQKQDFIDLYVNIMGLSISQPHMSIEQIAQKVVLAWSLDKRLDNDATPTPKRKL